VIRVLLADDEDMIRTALAALLRLEPDLEIVGECRDGAEAVAEAVRLEPDVCLFDVEMPGMDGIEAAERLRRVSATRVIVVTRHARPGVLRRALAVGVSGFLPKSRRVEDVAEVIRQVAAGRRYVDPEIAADALATTRSPLTDRELDVLSAGSRGETTGEIGRALHLSAGTVRNHVSSILRKLDVDTRQRAVIEARENGWI
jgi:two-component system response regulator DesR